MASGIWRFVLLDPAGKRLGEVTNAHDRTVSKTLSSIATASFRVRLDNVFSGALLNDDLLLLVYRNTELVFSGIIVSVEETADETGTRQLQVNAADAFWRLTKRLIPASRAEGGYSSTGSPAALVYALLDAVNAEVFSGVDFI